MTNDPTPVDIHDRPDHSDARVSDDRHGKVATHDTHGARAIRSTHGSRDTRGSEVVTPAEDDDDTLVAPPAAPVEPPPDAPARQCAPQPALAGVAFASLKAQAVIVTGGASGIGADIVRAFAAQGASVGFLDRDEAAGQALAAELPNAHFQLCDLADVLALQAAMAMLVARLGAVDVLVNNVANDDRHRIEDVTPEYYDGRIAINLRPHFFATQAVIGPMRERGGGAIVNLGSTSWKIKETGLLIYATAKSAMSGFTRSLARELGPDHIRVNCVLPGWVMTERQRALWVDEAGEREMDRSQCLAGRIVGADIANMVLFLAADTARMITAQEFVVDAGWC